MVLSDSSAEVAEKYNLNKNEIEANVDIEKNLRVFNNDLTFLNIKESQRTKHVHRLHPYLGKFIPQLVEVFLKKYFKQGDFILDPFVGSGTTLIVANELGINSVGVELSPFNALICKVKADVYDFNKLRFELNDILKKTKEFSENLRAGKAVEKFSTESKYLNDWFAPAALQEILFFRAQIGNYDYQDLFKVILSRAARSSRLITHYELARPKEPIKDRYWCIKHKRYCMPTEDAFKFIWRYGWDTYYRLKEFSEIRSNTDVIILQGDSRNINLPKEIKFDGIFTSPPYVGVIDYHDQHEYAYELFNSPRLDEKEIGPAKKGQGWQSREDYFKDIIAVFTNMKRFLKPNAKVFIVANDKFNLYPKIGKACGFELIDTFNRPVLMRTARTGHPYFESIFYFKNKES